VHIPLRTVDEQVDNTPQNSGRTPTNPTVSQELSTYERVIL